MFLIVLEMEFYYCEDCGKCFKSEVMLKIHKSNVHTLRRVNDQVVEASHHKVKQFFESRPNYNHKNKETEASGEATLRGIVHFNAFNINPSTKS